MAKNSPWFFKNFRIAFVLVGIFFTPILSAQVVDLDVGKNGYTIPDNEEETFNNVTLSDNASILTVNGTLIVQGNLTMDGNSSQFIMGDNALVIVYGNFQAHNSVDISVSSYLVVYGDFTQKTGSGKAEIDATKGNIYIFGNVDDSWAGFDTCPEYAGDVSDLGTESCDYGTGDNYEDNFEQFPEEFKSAVNCYDLSDLSNQTVCEGAPATFSVTEITEAAVIYEWQKKVGEGDWISVAPNPNTYTYTTPVTSIEDDGTLYRVVVKPSENTTGCKISISRKVTLTVEKAGIWKGIDSDWNNPDNWSCNSLPTLATNVIIPANLSNYPIINSGTNALSKDLSIEAGASVMVNNSWLLIAGDLTNSGVLNVETGNISFQGNAAQIIPAGAFENEFVQNLNIKNFEGVTSEANIRVLNSLKVEQGNFETGNALTLVSNASGTAYIDGSGAGQVTGTVKMQRYLSNAFGYKYFSTPFQNSTVGDLAANFDLTNSETGFPHLYEYLENREDILGNDATGWQKFLDENSALRPGFGYAINPSGVADTLTLELSGIVNNGPVNVVFENNGRTYTNGFNLVGNPYPSPLDWNLMVESLSGIDNAIHFFTAGSDDRYTGTYTSYIDGISTDGRSTSIIPSMQGFFVRVSDPKAGETNATANLQFQNTYRVGNQTGQKYYQVKNKAKVSQIKLTAKFAGEEMADATVIYFRNGATTQFEKDMDAQKLLNTAINVPSFYSLTSRQEKLSINAVSGTSMENIEIPLGITTERSGEMTIALSETASLFPSLNIYLKDNKKNVLKDLEKDRIYTFTSQKGENNDRFILLFSSKKLSPTQMVLAMEDFIVYTKNDMVWVKLNLHSSAEGKVTLSNMLGRAIQSKKGTGKEELNFSGMAAGVYLVTLESRNVRHTKKVIIKE